MASPVTHAVVAISLATAWKYPRPAWSFLVLGVISAEIPDLDVIGFLFGVPYGHPFGHRGFTHSLLFAGCLAGAVVGLGSSMDEWGTRRGSLWSFIFFATISHGLCDALTDGGLGVAFFVPFDSSRYFFPFRPVVVSPLDWRDAFSAVGVKVLRSEVIWIWIPCIILAGSWVWLQRRLRRQGRVKNFKRMVSEENGSETE
ncbi:MAG: metal-dependent hydrolase [Nitrospiraceae bacterium]|jgi:inner membrane protein